MKGIILTYAPLTQEEKDLLTNTKIYKLALNQHADELKPNQRIVTDYCGVQTIISKFKEPVVGVRVKHPSIKTVDYVEFKGATILAAIDFCIYNGITDLLLVADNTVHNKEFQNIIIRDLQEEKGINLFQYRNGNFPLATKSVRDFIYGI